MQPASTPEQALATLRDVEGVQGSFVVSKDGELLCHDMPQYLDAGTLSEVGPRACRIFEAWSLDSAGSECLLRFVNHKLYMRGVGGQQGAVLCALVAPDVHLTAMRTATQLVGRRVADWLVHRAQPAAIRRAPPPLPVRMPEPPPPAGAVREPSRRQPVAQPARPKRVRIYRGQRFEY